MIWVYDYSQEACKLFWVFYLNLRKLPYKKKKNIFLFYYCKKTGSLAFMIFLYKNGIDFIAIHRGFLLTKLSNFQ